MSAFFVSCLMIFSLAASGCMVLDTAGEVVGVIGKAGWGATKAVGSMVYTGTSVAGQTANQTNKTLVRNPPTQGMTTISMEQGRIVVPLERQGTSFFVQLKLNGKVPAKFLLDTVASAMQVSRAMATKLKLKVERAKTVPVMLAGGGYVRGRLVDIPKVSIGAATVNNVRAIVLDRDNMGLMDGLLGMSFLENFIFSIDTKKGMLILEKRK